MARRNEHRSRRPGRTAHHADHERSAVETASIVIGWVLLVAVAPIVLVLGVVMPVLSGSTVPIAIGLASTSGLSLLLAYRGRLVASGIVLVLATWALFTVVAWFRGGVDSASVAAYFLIVILAAMVHDWRWGLATALLTVATVWFLAWAQTEGRLPDTGVVYGPWDKAAAYSGYLLAIGGLQALLAQSISGTRRRAAHAMAEQKAAEKRLLDVVDNAPFGAFVCELNGDGRLEITHANTTASTVLGIDAYQFEGRTLDEAFRALRGGTVLSTFKGIAIEGGNHSADAVPFEVDGRHVTLEMHAFQLGARSMAVFFSDVTRRRREQVQIRHAAFHDELTQLPNRKLFVDRLTLALAAAKRHSTHVALLFIDLDNFKPINDRYGHSAGDALLVAVARRLQECARSSDTIARFGGDEFAMLMPEVDRLDQVEALAKKLVAAFGEPFLVDEQALRISASIGVAMATSDKIDANTLFEHADTAMYRMKAEGRGGYRVFTPRLGPNELT